MFEGFLRVKYVSFKNCFVYLCPEHKYVNTGVCIKIISNNREFYFSASVIRALVDEESIGINSSYAKVLGIREGEFVNVVQLEQLPVVNSISVRPFNKPDYELLEILSMHIQSNLLDQVRVVNSQQELIIWTGNLSVTVLVENVQPISPGTLDFLTEVIIKPPESNSFAVKEANSHKIPLKEAHMKLIEYLHSSFPLPQPSSSANEIAKELYCRVLPLSKLPSKFTSNNPLLPPFNAYICGFDSISFHFKTQFCSISPINSPEHKKLYIKLTSLEDQLESCRGTLIFIDDSLFSHLNCDFGARVVLTEITQKPRVEEIEVHSKRNHLSKIVNVLKKYLANHCEEPQIFNAGFPIHLDKKWFCSLKFLPNNDDFCIIDEHLLREVCYSVVDDPVKPAKDNLRNEPQMGFCKNMANIMKVCGNLVEVYFRKNRFVPENVLISGNSGTGKSSVLTHIGEILKCHPYFVNSEKISCKKIKGKTVDSLHKLFTEIFVKLILTQPSVLILDDLHVLCERNDGEESPNTVYVNRVSEMLSSLFCSVLKHNSIGILATTESLEKLNKSIYKSRGNHLFKNVFDIGNLSKIDRAVFLKHLFEEDPLDENVDFESLAVKTDGFAIQDIKDFHDKTVFEAHKENPQQALISQQHCECALKKSCALSLQNVIFHPEGTKTFNDIGGLHNVKNTLIESVLWPVKFPTIFENSPLRLQSGVLLYGPPGTGKTLLAGAAAKQFNLRLISIKGPELLSKYIGASEQAVRDVFEKAQRAKPCILFFDEFDSLAPRRGHDNTGVTDRVVNQLLTQLDGVEALTGVCVLAATSRPDLLDPALLRPGRLDKQLFCPMPDKADRLEILTILSGSLSLATDVNLDQIAVMTEGFSGADLQSLLYTVKIGGLSKEPRAPGFTTQLDLLDALDVTRPSLTQTDKAKYDKIYAKFQGAISEEFQTGSKVTLA
ncbi:peroxisome biogenesis factor 1 [Anthonomus grandis grandis]|uniref:peroxisome biogenesis factor 1 n=1 Tax=Anthonomus grandis grandis TaxID=2921223 RepID=UPI00216632CD|nr:peroxisome biogenesis factor 1 [Anthonomus grandis grandis]